AAQNPSHTYNSAGSFTATLTVTGSNGQSSSANQTITVTNAPPSGNADFSIAVSPSSKTIKAGQSGYFTVTVTPTATGGHSGTVSLTASGLPLGATASLSPAWINSSGNSTLSILTSPSSPRADAKLTITGTVNGVMTHSSDVSLRIR